MPTYKCTWLFNAGKQGWSESWYWDGATHEDCRQAAGPVTSARRLLMAKGTIIEAVRISDISIRGDSIYLDEGPLPAPTGDVGERDEIDTAWLCRFEAGPNHRRMVLLRGLWDSWVFWDPVTQTYPIPNEFRQKFNSWVRAIQRQGFKLRVIDNNPAVAGNWLVTSIVAGVGSLTITAPGSTLVQNDMLRLSGGKYLNANNPKGVYRVTQADGPSFTVGYTGPLPIQYDKDARVGKRVPINVDITQAFPERPGSRKTGRAFFVPRGRRKGKR